MKCTFCGSSETLIETPYIDRWTGEHKRVPCCSAQSKNMDYLKKRVSPYQEDKPTLEDLSKI